MGVVRTEKLSVGRACGLGQTAASRNHMLSRLASTDTQSSTFIPPRFVLISTMI